MATEVDELVRAHLARGDGPSAVDLTLRRLGGEIQSYLHATLRDADAAREVYAEMAEQLLVALPRYRGESSVRTYVYAIAWNLARVHRRQTSRDRRRFGAFDDGLAEAAAPRTPTPAYRRTTAKERLQEARARLTPEERNLIVLRVDRDMSWRDIGEILGTGGSPAETAVLRKRFERLVRRLREFLAVE